MIRSNNPLAHRDIDEEPADVHSSAVNGIFVNTSFFLFKIKTL